MKEKNDNLYRFDDDKCIEFRMLSSEDSISEITLLLNKSYKLLSDKGLNYLAATQDDEITMNRIEKAYKCFVGIYNNKIVSTISLYAPRPSNNSSWYNEKFVAKVGQFAVAPEYQKYGIGGKMMDIIEREAGNIDNASEISLDTAETAYHLINFYDKRGYRYIETIDWDVTNYKSVIMSKSLY